MADRLCELMHKLSQVNGLNVIDLLRFNLLHVQDAVNALNKKKPSLPPANFA
jgi:hypothetical protein